MKSEERHELKTNELEKFTHQAGLFFETWGNQILLGIVAVILVATAIVWWQRSARSSAAAGWTELAAARSAEDFANVADKFPGTPAVAAARLSEAEEHLLSGVRLAFTDRAAAVSDLKAAREAYSAALDSPALPEDLRPQALFGLARALETTSDSNTTEAVKAYEKLATDYPGSIYAEEAKKRAAALKTGGAQEFYAWFHQQQPKPSDLDRPTDGLPFGHPPIDGSSTSLPEIPDDLRLNETDGTQAPPFPATGTDAAPADSEKTPEDAPAAPESK